MALKSADRVKETTTTTGTGALSLGGAMTGFNAFSSALSNADTCYYALQAVDSNGNPTGDWETGLGTYNSSGNTLSRTTVLASSNAGSAVSLSAGTKQVWIDLLAARLLQWNASAAAAGHVPMTDAQGNVAPISPLAAAYGATVGTPAIGSLGTVHPDTNITLSNSGTDWLESSVGGTAGSASALNGYTMALSMTSGQRVGLLCTIDGITQNSSNFFGAAVGFTDGTKFHVATRPIVAASNGILNSSIEQWASSTSRFASTAVTKPWMDVPTFWFGIRYDGTNYNIEYSLNRIKWFPITTMTPNYLSSYSTLFFGSENFAGANAGVTFLSIDTAS